MVNTWIVADTHFSHRNVTQFLREDGSKLRPWDDVDEMDEVMVQNWNSVVKPNDRVYHLGDVVINRKALPILDRLNGRKILVRGNHDIFKLQDYAKYFDDIRGTHKLDTYVLSHIPIHECSIARWSSGNIHGHLHQYNVRKSDGSLDERYICVSVEQINYTPISFEEIKRGR